MYRAGMKRLAVAMMIAWLALASLAPAGAQEQALDQQQRAALAAIPLITSALPDGYRFAGEGFLPADQAGGPGVDPAALTDAGAVAWECRARSCWPQPAKGRHARTRIVRFMEWGTRGVSRRPRST